jgi:hypothetical protein
LLTDLKKDSCVVGFGDGGCCTGVVLVGSDAAVDSSLTLVVTGLPSTSVGDGRSKPFGVSDEDEFEDVVPLLTTCSVELEDSSEAGTLTTV